MKLIATQTLATAAASIEFTSIPQTFTDLVILFSFRDTGTNSTARAFQTALTLNGSTTGFSARGLGGQGSSTFSFSDTPRFGGWHPDAAATSNTFSNTMLYIPNYTGSTNKSYSIDNVIENNETLSYQGIIAGLWSNIAAITSVGLPTTGTNLAIGSTASLYGILKGSDGIVTTS